MSKESPDAWPYFRDNPDKVVLGVRSGHAPSDLPPVRIFLGTEEAQYRAERIFFFSVEKVRDPSRVYEIHLMKNVAGFDRRRWRTGFTNYRYAIPDFAGGLGKAIYNDVDQIYLADPALLFDLGMEGHGYRAIDPSDTSVMLIDCARMLPMWNRAAASTGNKYSLLAKPRKTPGLWGPIDPHWNARDQEYAEGLTKCLHYTALHQQPWEPFPGGYSYHANPLGYLWHGLEREADEEGYQVFERETPSPGLRARLGSNAPRPDRRPGERPSAGAKALTARLGIGSCLAFRASGAAPLPLDSLAIGQVTAFEVRGNAGDWPPSDGDLVVAHDLLEVVPPADVGWLLDELFARARKAVYVTLDAAAADGLGSPDWWRRRIALSAARHPGVSWHADLVDPRAVVHPRGVLRMPVPGHARVLALQSGGPGDAAARRLADGLGWGCEVLRVAGHDPDPGRPAVPPSPDIVISPDSGTLEAARRIKNGADGQPRIVQLGRPDTRFAGIDLIVARPDDDLPIRENVLQTTGPLALPEASGSNGGWAEKLAGRPRPLVLAIVTGGRHPRVMPETVAAELGRKAAALAQQGTLLAVAERPEAEAAARTVAAAGGGELLAARPAELDLLIEAVDKLVLTTDQPERAASACLAGRELHLQPLPLWHDRHKALRPLVKLLRLASGGGTTYRGTPHQQHFIGRWLDALTVRGLRTPARDDTALFKSLVARGLARWLGEPPVVHNPRPPDDLPRAVERVRRLLSEEAVTG